jgi:hypothetical protein
MRSDADLEKEVEEALSEARRTKDRRREMKSGQVKETLWGPMKFVLIVDLPTDMPEENFKKYMVEYGAILQEAFSGRH